MRKFVIPIVATLVFFSPSVVEGKNDQKSRAEKIASCKSIPSTVAERRQATWKWEKELRIQTTPTSYMERKTSSCRYLKSLKRKWSLRADKRYRTVVKLERDPRAAISWVFGAYASQAISVAWCESRLKTWASNGQYLGLFQMGSTPRSLYGHGSTAIEQARAAKRYFDRSGRDWSPWQCRPGGHLGW